MAQSLHPSGRSYSLSICISPLHAAAAATGYTTDLNILRNSRKRRARRNKSSLTRHQYFQQSRSHITKSPSDLLAQEAVANPITKKKKRKEQAAPPSADGTCAPYSVCKIRACKTDTLPCGRNNSSHRPIKPLNQRLIKQHRSVDVVQKCIRSAEVEISLKKMGMMKLVEEGKDGNEKSKRTLEASKSGHLPYLTRTRRVICQDNSKMTIHLAFFFLSFLLGSNKAISMYVNQSCKFIYISSSKVSRLQDLSCTNKIGYNFICNTYIPI